MIAGLKPYADYKDAGHNWLGAVPAHWRALRGKTLFREVDERSKTGKEELLSVSHLTGVTPRRLNYQLTSQGPLPLGGSLPA